ncbi:MAG: hypothetical protein OXC05_06895 [Halieaceae bacterium]|nr:hypothetical protein [Halieaceae bacterium]
MKHADQQTFRGARILAAASTEPTIRLMIKAFLETLTSAYVLQVIRFRYPMVIVSIASMVLLCMQAIEMRVETELDYFYEDGYQGLQDLKELKETYSDFKATILMVWPLQEPISQRGFDHHFITIWYAVSSTFHAE